MSVFGAVDQDGLDVPAGLVVQEDVPLVQAAEGAEHLLPQSQDQTDLERNKTELIFVGDFVHASHTQKKILRQQEKL